MDVTGWAIDRDALEDFLAEPNLCRVGTVGPDGDPHVVPAWHWWDGERFWVGAEAADRKVADIRRTGRAAIEVDADVRRKRGILAVGAAEVYDGEEGLRRYVRVTAEQVRRYQPDKPPQETAERYASKGEPVVIGVTPGRIVSWGR